MGIIIRKSFWISAISYTGAGIGYINLLWLFPQFLDIDDIGLLRFVQEAATFLLPFAMVGLNTSLIRYKPLLYDKDDLANGFVTFLLMLAIACYGVFFVAFTFFEAPIMAYFSKNAPETAAFSSLVLLIILLMVLHTLMEAYSRSLLELEIVTVVREVVLRLSTSVAVSGYGLGYYSLHTMVYSLAIIWALMLATVTTYLIVKRRLRLSFDFGFLRSLSKKEFGTYSLYSMLSGASSGIVLRIDHLMITSMLGLAATGLYSTLFYMAILVEFPRRAISQVAGPLLSKAFASQDFDTIRSIYKKSSVNLQFMGTLLYIGILANLPNLFKIMPQGDSFAMAYWVFVIIGAGKLVDMIAGVNNELLQMSPHYRYVLYLIVFFAVMCIILNLALIPVYGINGAALASLVAMLIFNSIKVMIIKKFYQVHPFGAGNAKLLLITAVTLIPAVWIPYMDSPLLDIILRSAVISLVFTGCALLWKVSGEINAIAKRGFALIGINW